MDDERDEEEAEPTFWWQLLQDVLLISGAYGTVSAWYPREGWQHWAAYPIAFGLAWYCFDRARDLRRWLAERRNTPTIQP
ncbi:hypothetical protein [Kineosporia babensis]|uniref:Uncharacterized protein n=1 Tax=Kineosporia babensis TaxID=499548 RepID=A0A9X1SY61_9ACTN|nr:hypothetical protein [Kineosporia babensis]MCD5316932.1 hypothetical protein [Kineosporia babensis]